MSGEKPMHLARSHALRGEIVGSLAPSVALDLVEFVEDEIYLPTLLVESCRKPLTIRWPPRVPTSTRQLARREQPAHSVAGLGRPGEPAGLNLLRDSPEHFFVSDPRPRSARLVGTHSVESA